jgi:hypothetical protein
MKRWPQERGFDTPFLDCDKDSGWTRGEAKVLELRGPKPTAV